MLVFPWSIASNKINKGKMCPRKLFTHMKKVLRKYWDRKKLFEIHLSNDYPELTNYEISE